jgi:lipopolysaccharide biosynthesis regulator YciM
VALLVLTVTGLVLLPVRPASMPRGARGRMAGRRAVRRDYLRGLNFPSTSARRALESFMRVVEVDHDTVEMHLALGGLFRRRGEIDRAIRIHQNIVARDNIDGTLREQALYALAQDYQRAGLFDRAEEIFQELSEGGAYRLPAMRELVGIYELEREWHRARCASPPALIGRPRQETAILHYFCELAEVDGRRDARACARVPARGTLRSGRRPAR